MKKILAALLCSWCALGQAQTADELISDGKNTENVTTLGMVNGNWTFAIDVATGRQIWRTPVQYDRAALRVTTGGAYLRGALSGRGGSNPTRAAGNMVPAGGSVWTFALMAE
jgi:hypothetical protein